MEGKPSLQSAEKYAKYGNFPKAFQECKRVVDSDAFRHDKGKKQHEAIKKLIAYGQHCQRCVQLHDVLEP